VTGLWFSQASDAIAAANQDGTVQVRDAGAPDSVRPPIATGSVVRLAVDSHAGLLVSATCKLILGGTCSPDDDAHIQTFDLQRSAAAGPPLVVSPDGVSSLQLLPSAAVASGDAGPTLRIFLPRASEITVLDMQNDRVGPDPVAVADALGGLGPGVVRVGAERVAALGCVLAGQGAACPAGTVHLADARTGAAIGQNLVGEPPAGVSSLAATVDGAALAAGRVDGRIDIWDLSTGVRRPGLPPMDSGGRVSALAFAADGRLAAAAPWPTAGLDPGQSSGAAKRRPVDDQCTDERARLQPGCRYARVGRLRGQPAHRGGYPVVVVLPAAEGHRLQRESDARAGLT
jgi:hypothetical protein